jgi:dCTP deaminase
MYLSDRDLARAISDGQLIFDPAPKTIDPTSIDLHLGKIDDVRIWDIAAFTEHEEGSGRDRPELNIGNYKIGKFGRKYLIPPPTYLKDAKQLVGMRHGSEVIVKPCGFVLWPTNELVGTPSKNAKLICFVDGKSTKARAGMVVHLTAPTIHSTWTGNITLEIANFGPFDLVFRPGDAVAQLTVAMITNPPEKGMDGTSATHGQTKPYGKD